MVPSNPVPSLPSHPIPSRPIPSRPLRPGPFRPCSHAALLLIWVSGDGGAAETEGGQHVKAGHGRQVRARTVSARRADQPTTPTAPTRTYGTRGGDNARVDTTAQWERATVTLTIIVRAHRDGEWTDHSTNCPLAKAQCPMPEAQCPVPNVHCPLSTVHLSSANSDDSTDLNTLRS